MPLIDTAPTVNNALIVALASADFVVCPIELEVYSIQGIKNADHLHPGETQNEQQAGIYWYSSSKVDGRNPRHVKPPAGAADGLPYVNGSCVCRVAKQHC
ncbi:ParA family protein [Escherichia coli]|uniref:ParA family protein n=1 Tax=Escherichia coli TaxID=562 RepID=UPI00388EBA44